MKVSPAAWYSLLHPRRDRHHCSRRLLSGLACLLFLCAPAWGQTTAREGRSNPALEPTTITIGAEDDAAPWSYADGTGYVNELVTKIFSAVGWHVNLKVLPYARCKNDAALGLLIACFSTSKAPELEATMMFPKEPVINPHFVLYGSTRSSFTSCDASTWVKPPEIALVRGYEYLPVIERMRAAKAFHAVSVNSEASSLRMLASGRVDAAIITVDAVKRFEMLLYQANLDSQQAMGLTKLCDFGVMPAYLAFGRKHPDSARALAAFEAGIAIMKARGEITQLEKHWAKTALALERTRRGRATEN